MEAVQEKHELRVLNATGDSKFIWNPDNEDETAAAKAQFDALKGKGYLAFDVGKGGKKNESINAFDPELGKIIMTPPIKGG